jgi:hypothetical protein
MSDSDERKIWYVLDEFSDIPKSPAFLSYLAKSRSKGGSYAIIGSQDIEQIREVYGESHTNALLSKFSTVISLKLGPSGPSAQKAAETFGQRHISVCNVSESGGKRTASWQDKMMQLVTAEDIAHLPDANKHGISGFMMSSGFSACYELNWRYPSVPIIAEEFVAADWLSKPRTPANQKPIVEVENDWLDGVNEC